MRPLIAIVGAGRIGSLRASILVEEGFPVIAIDPRPPCNAGLETVPNIGEVQTLPAAWIIATPTSTHLRVLTQIMRRDPTAAVLVEKPACTPEQLTRLRELLLLHRHCAIEFASQYCDSAAVRALVEETQPGADVVISFVKDRRREEEMGRFRDSVSGVLGYEWPHLYSIARALGVLHSDLNPVDPDKSMLSVIDDDGYLVEARWETTGADGRRVVLHSGINGAESHLLDTCAPDPSNYRLVQTNNTDGRTSTLWLAPSRLARDRTPRARNSLLVCDSSGRRRLRTIAHDPLRSSMLAALERLIEGCPRENQSGLEAVEHITLLLNLRSRAVQGSSRHATA
ncbi:Gfo/Idh/MocA family oxidoreductase [Curtobacterium flaccumfaciens pv. oortii]|uniref:Gfo/Idh/MocA family oxidoreductase n=1 Tax=Curtobacterium flaccumfaciens TaxID=2035 RepID=UPI00265B1F1F|nr:Gfo/Idh/MocA family oxidoreductase [Curtobacterium flaccumfaciens]MCS5524743.1 Gfo/Idh/MocA family oxidoreductase [Curtobacterium flaccumfaciens pv. oortii]